MNKILTIVDINDLAYKKYGIYLGRLSKDDSLILAEYIFKTTGQDTYEKIRIYRKKLGLLTEYPGKNSKLVSKDKPPY